MKLRFNFISNSSSSSSILVIDTDKYRVIVDHFIDKYKYLIDSEDLDTIVEPLDQNNNITMVKYGYNDEYTYINNYHQYYGATPKINDKMLSEFVHEIEKDVLLRDDDGQ